MWIVRYALRRPYTIGVAAVMIFIMGLLSIKSMLIDIFPVIDIPVVGIVWSYPGLSAEDMERRVVIISERAMSTIVGGIARIESQSIPGVGLLRVYFQPGTDIGAAIAEINAASNTILRILPPGMTPPNIVQFNASNVPVAQYTLTSDTLSEEKIFDYALNFIRIKLFTIPGLSVPAPYGGLQREINIDVDPSALNGRGLSPNDVVNALQASNIILPAGTARIGRYEYNVAVNSSPDLVSDFEKIPIKVVGRRPVLIGDVAKVADAFADQTNIVRVDGRRASYLNILRKSDASTLTVVEAARRLIPEILATAPKGLKIKLDFDQSVFVRAAIGSVLREALVSSLLVSIMVLVFLGSWRSVIVVCTSIPLAILCGVIGLKLTGNSINIMTLGGLSLAIGMLVDDATVEVENIHRNRHLGHPLTVAILNGASQIALPAIMATLAICIVFSPVALLTGPARFLFVPMALAVVFSMLASYVLSRTLVPVLCRMLMVDEPLDLREDPASSKEMRELHRRREGLFESLQNFYGGILDAALARRRFVLGVFFALLAASAFLPFLVGSDFFPATDTGLMKLHFRAPSGTRIEETEKLVAQAEDEIRRIIPADELQTINSMIGLPIYYNLAFVPTDNVGGMDAEMLISLKPDHHPTVGYMKKIRRALALRFPGSTTYFQSADIVSQVLNFGVSAPVDLQIEGRDVLASYGYARRLRDLLRAVPGVEDVAIKQVFDYPNLHFDVDRVRASQLGIAQRDVANSLLTSLSSSQIVAPSYYVNPNNNVNYSVVVKTPLRQLASVQDLLNTPITPPSAGTLLQDGGFASPSRAPGAPSQRLGNLALMRSAGGLDEISHLNVQRIVDLTANVESRDLGSVLSDINRAIATLGKLPPGVAIHVRGQGEIMHEAFSKLGLGLILAIALVYLLIAVLFQSWLDPFIVLVAVPGALIGILWMLLATGTTINVESFLGAIMAVGIAASNSILLVSFANDVRVEKGVSPLEGARLAGITRLRPVLMTAAAMIIGMLPTALALGEGGEQNAPLGRAVIGGLLVATIVTLIVVPVVYSLLRTGEPTMHLLDERFRREEAGLEPHAATTQHS
ncbi:MAG: efflux RND transporter permease subunit [Elusimicrobia bacterium]|nr:efflux RND transporter permease subunit [Elusimicrobiota bacterium]